MPTRASDRGLSGLQSPPSTVTTRGFGTGVNVGGPSTFAVAGPSLLGSARPNLIENNRIAFTSACPG